MAFLARTAFPESDIVQCSDHESVDQTSLRKDYYAHLRKLPKEAISVSADLSEAEVADMVARCRLLRKLSPVEAQRHVHAMANAVRSMLIRHRPDVVLSATVDSYVVDLIRHVCGVMGIRFLGLVATFVDGYFRITARGERTVNPAPDLSIIEEIREKLLQPMYAPEYMGARITHPRRIVLERWIKNAVRVPYFWAKRFLLRDVYNHHYWSSQLCSAEYVSAFPPEEPGRGDWEQILKKDKRTPLYIPLQMFPECTVDYWSEDLSAVDFYDALGRLIDAHHESFHILIKEHPAVLGNRPRSFYRTLQADPRITVVPTCTPSNYVLDKVPAVLVWTGTVGYEAALRGKAVICLCAPYYAHGKRFLRINPETSSEMLLHHVSASMSQPVTRDEQEELLRHLVAQLFKGSFTNDGSWSAASIVDIEDAETMARSLRALACA